MRVIPENFEGAVNGFLIPDGRFPIPKAVRLQVGIPQQLADRRVIDGVYILLFN